MGCNLFVNGEYIGAITYLLTFYTLCGTSKQLFQGTMSFQWSALACRATESWLRGLKKVEHILPKGGFLWQFTMVQNLKRIKPKPQNISHRDGFGKQSWSLRDYFSVCCWTSCGRLFTACPRRRRETVGPFKTQERAEIHTHTHSGKTCSTMPKKSTTTHIRQTKCKSKGAICIFSRAIAMILADGSDHL